MIRKVTIPAFLLILIGIIGLIFTGKDYFTFKVTGGEETFDATNIQSISIDSSVANINVQPSETDEIKVVWENKRSTNKERNMDIQVDGDELSIELKEKGILSWLNLDFGFNFKKFVVDVYVPNKQYEMININNNVGLTTISSVDVTDLAVHTDVADVMIENVESNYVNVTSSVGRMTLKDVVGKIKATNDVGEIVVLADDIYEDMTLTSNVGNIKVKVPKILDHISFHGNSDIGNVNIFGQKRSYLSNHQRHIVYIETEIGNIDVVIE